MKGVESLRIQSFSRRAFGNPKNPVIRFFGIPGSWFWKNPGISWDPAGACPHHIPIPFFSIIIEAKLLIRGKRLGKMVQMSYVEGCWHQNWGCSRPTDDFTITTHKICIFHKTGRTRKLSMCFFLHEEYPRHLTPFPSITSNCQVEEGFRTESFFWTPPWFMRTNRLSDTEPINIQLKIHHDHNVQPFFWPCMRPRAPFKTHFPLFTDLKTWVPHHRRCQTKWCHSSFCPRIYPLL